MADLSHNKPGPGYLGRIGICTHTKREEGGERREEGGGRGEGGGGVGKEHKANLENHHACSL